MSLVLLSLLGCPPSSEDDTGKTRTTDDTGTTTPVSLDDVVPTAVDRAWGCRWVYGVAEAGGYTVVADVELGQDELARADFSEAHALAGEDEVVIAGGLGADTLTVFDCSDVMDNAEGTHVWRATAGTLQVDAVYVEDRPDWTCSGTDDNPVYTVSWSILGGTFVDEDGVIGTLDAWGPVETQVADYCGG